MSTKCPAGYCDPEVLNQSRVKETEDLMSALTLAQASMVSISFFPGAGHSALPELNMERGQTGEKF